MMTQEELEFYRLIESSVAAKPHWAFIAISAATDGNKRAFEALDKRAADWETIAIMTTSKIVLKNNGPAMADKIESIGEANMRINPKFWSDVAAKMRASK